MSDAPPPGVTTAARSFRPRSARTAAAVWGLVTAGWLWLALTDGGARGLLRQLPWAVLAAALVWSVLVRPAVLVGPHGVRLRNPWRDVDVPWSALEQVETRFALTLRTTDGRSWSAWAAPASGRWNDPRMTRTEVGALALDDDEAPTASASWSSSSGAVAAWIRRERRRAVPGAADLPVTTRVAWPVVVLLAAPAAASLLTLLV